MYEYVGFYQRLSVHRSRGGHFGGDAVDAYYIELCPLGGAKILTIGWPGMHISHTGRLGDQGAAFDGEMTASR